MNNLAVQTFFDTPSNYLHKDYGVKVRRQIVADLLGYPRDKRILDMGCGDGRISLQFANYNTLTLVDSSENMLRLAKSHTAAGRILDSRLIRSDLSHFHSAEKFDVVIAMGLLAHVPSLEEALTQLSQLTTDCGQIVLQFSDAASALTRLSLRRKRAGYQVNRIDSASVERLSAANELTLLREARYSIMLPGMGKLPNRWLASWAIRTYRTRWLQPLTSERVWLLSKATQPACRLHADMPADTAATPLCQTSKQQPA